MASTWPTSPDTLDALLTDPDQKHLSEAGTGSFNHWQHHKKAAEAIDKLQLVAATLDHTHSGTGARSTAKLAQANTHQSPDTDTSINALHHTLGWGANQAAQGSAVQAAFNNISSSWNTLADKPATFPSTWDTVASKPTTFPSTWDTVANKPTSFPPNPHDHNNLYWTQAQSDGRYATAPLWGRAVGDVTGTNFMGLRWNGNRIVGRVDNSEWELAFKGDADGAQGGVNDLYGRKADGFNDTNTVRYTRGPDGTAYERGLQGFGFVAVWMDNTLQFGRNTSSIRFKEDVKPFSYDSKEVLSCEPVTYHRKGSEERYEFGMIAEQVNEHLPGIVTWHAEPDVDEEGKAIPGVSSNPPQIDGIRYDLLAVAQQSVLREFQERITVLENLLKDKK